MRSENNVCGVLSCNLPVRCKGLCASPYSRMLKLGSPGETPIKQTPRWGTKNVPLRSRWQNMIARCHSPNHQNYQQYGGRGIYVCSAWRNSFDVFVADMGVPDVGMTLERIDNNGPYSAKNCKWAHRQEQANNRRNNHLLTIEGKTMTTSEWSRDAGIPLQTILQRLRMGWSAKKAVTVRPKQRRRITNEEALEVLHSNLSGTKMAQKLGVSTAYINKMRSGGYKWVQELVA